MLNLVKKNKTRVMYYIILGFALTSLFPIEANGLVNGTWSNSKNRHSRSTCREDQFHCRDGTCISWDKKCDGAVDCPDGSDEIHETCRTLTCPDYLFRCTYGACVDGTAACNGVKDCADNSDELIPKCRNDVVVNGDKFKCDDGQWIDVFLRCDGNYDCADNSDESLRSCGSIVCPSHLFQCAYGACIDEGSDCNNIDECADGSDESDILCNRKIPRKPPNRIEIPMTSSPKPTICTVPDHPENGFFMNENYNYTVGTTEARVYLFASCHPTYKLIGDSFVYCENGDWFPDILPTCQRACKVEESVSVVYRCLKDDLRGSDGIRECDELEVEGTKMEPQCRRPNYYSPIELPYMICSNGRWNYQPKCLPECGTMTPKGEPLVVGGKLADTGDVPWHAGIYAKNGTSYEQICGGSIISESVILSAAHCFSGPASSYAVAVGKLYREWDNDKDQYPQTSDVKEIRLADYYYGDKTLFQNDLAIVVVQTPFTYRPHVRPVCLDFGREFHDEQLRARNYGKAAGWGLTTGYAHSESPRLKVLDMPFVPYDECVRITPDHFAQFLIASKFCAGYRNGTTLCKGDSGGGLTFPAKKHGVTRYYLRGIVSVSPPSQGDAALCNLKEVTAFEKIIGHATLIRKYWLA